MDREVVLITGSRTGIGKMLAHHFLERGAVVKWDPDSMKLG